MIYKILLIIYIVLGVLQIKTLFNTKDLQEFYNEKFEKPDEKYAFFKITAAINLITMISLIIFYSMSYNLSQLIGWLSVVQILWAMINFLTGFVMLGNLELGKYKKKKLSYRVVATLFDVYYGGLVIIAIL